MTVIELAAPYAWPAPSPRHGQPELAYAAGARRTPAGGPVPGGQMFLPLHGHTPGRAPVEPADALASLLQDVPGEALLRQAREIFQRIGTAEAAGSSSGPSAGAKSTPTG